MTVEEREVMASLACICAQVLHFMPDEADEHLSLDGVQGRINHAIALLAADTHTNRGRVRDEIYDFLEKDDD